MNDLTRILSFDHCIVNAILIDKPMIQLMTVSALGAARLLNGLGRVALPLRQDRALIVA